MSVLERASLHASAFLMAATGLIYGWLRYFGQRLGDFGPEPHPLQSLLQHLHVLSAPLLVFTLGMLLRGHVQPMLRRRPPVGKRTGLGSIFTVAPMVLAGYGVQVAVDPAWRTVLAWIHGVASLAFLAGYLGHLARTREQARRDREAGLD
ncbi:MAG: hypothetical protein U0P81_10015 [Holophagaceae bacterium]